MKQMNALGVCVLYVFSRYIENAHICALTIKEIIELYCRMLYY